MSGLATLRNMTNDHSVDAVVGDRLLMNSYGIRESLRRELGNVELDLTKVDSDLTVKGLIALYEGAWERVKAQERAKVLG